MAVSVEAQISLIKLEISLCIFADILMNLLRVSSIDCLRSSTRIPQAPDRYGYYVDVEEYELGDLDEPPNYKAALADPESDKWLELPLNGGVVGSKWIFKKKTDMDGNVHTFKARLVAKGYTQTYGVDYGETFYPVADIRAIRILLAITAFYDYEIWQMDVKTTFLNGHLTRRVYESKHPNKGLEVSSIWRIQGIRYCVLEFLRVGTTFDIFQDIHILYLQYGVLTSSGYGILIFFPL
ncbi:putative retrotransposon ty1-copia subclass protein, partial [Tanacetum coccineum]